MHGQGTALSVAMCTVGPALLFQTVRQSHPEALFRSQYFFFQKRHIESLNICTLFEYMYTLDY